LKGITDGYLIVISSPFAAEAVASRRGRTKVGVIKQGNYDQFLPPSLHGCSRIRAVPPLVGRDIKNLMKRPLLSSWRRHPLCGKEEHRKAESTDVSFHMPKPPLSGERDITATSASHGKGRRFARVIT